MNHHFHKQVSEIERRAGVTIDSIEQTGKGHLRLIFEGGHVIIGNSPSCRRATLNAVSQIRRIIRTPHHAT
jgi:hypothetical protein